MKRNKKDWLIGSRYFDKKNMHLDAAACVKLMIAARGFIYRARGDH